MIILRIDTRTYGIIEREVDPSVDRETGAVQVGVMSIYYDHAFDGSGADNLVVEHPSYGALDLEFLRSVVMIEVAD